MRRLRGWIKRFGGLFNKGRKDRELQEELESHIQMHTDDNLRSGMTPEESRRQALISLGGIESTKEAYREQRGLLLLESLLKDLHFATRMLLKNPRLHFDGGVDAGVGDRSDILRLHSDPRRVANAAPISKTGANPARQSSQLRRAAIEQRTIDRAMDRVARGEQIVRRHGPVTIGLSIVWMTSGQGAKRSSGLGSHK